jgi:hypothetical protein
MTETDLAIVAALRAGVTKALRDTRTAAAFLIGKTHPDPDHPFWDTLQADVSRDDTELGRIERTAYKKIKDRFMQEWLAANFVPLPSDVALASALPGFTVVEVDRDDLVEALRNEGAIGLQKLIAQQQGGPSPEQLMRWARARQANLDAGKCLGCGGTTTQDGSCAGDGDENYDPDDDSTLRREVSETGVRYLPVYRDPAEVHAEIDATVTFLRAQVDQLRAEDGELFRLTGEHDAGLAYKIGRIDAEIVKLTGNTNDAKGI